MAEPTVSEVYRILVDFREEVRQERADEVMRARALAEEVVRANTELRKAIFVGNGEPGLMSRTARLEERTKNLGRIVAAIVGAWLGFKGSGG